MKTTTAAFAVPSAIVACAWFFAATTCSFATCSFWLASMSATSFSCSARKMATETSASASVVAVFRSFIFSSIFRSRSSFSRSISCVYFSRNRIAISRFLIGREIADGGGTWMQKS